MSIQTTCTWCKSPMEITTKARTDMFRRVGRAYCQDACRDAFVKRNNSERMARTNREHASERMTANNPMRRPESKEKMRTSLRAMGWGPSVRGGNGRPLSAAQQLLACALGWPTEVCVKTGEKKGGGNPTGLKLDIANETLKIAVEVDGRSHGPIERQGQDRRKDRILTKLGWLVLRFKNEVVVSDLAGCVTQVLEAARDR